MLNRGLAPAVRAADGGDFDRIARFQSLVAGQYWRAREAITKEAIQKGEVLLIESVRHVDGNPHTVILRTHPSKYDRVAFIEEVVNDRTVKYDRKLKEHRFLIDDFLGLFDFEPDAEFIRNKELGDLQLELNRLQSEMTLFVSDSGYAANLLASSASCAEDGTTADASINAAGPEVDLESRQLLVGSVANALTSALTPSHVAGMRAVAEHHIKDAERRSQWIAKRSEAISQTLAKMAPFFHEKSAAALAGIQDVRDSVRSILDGLASLDLYLGKDVLVRQIRTGRDAEDTIPLTFVQKRLYMDEELAVFVDVDQEFDFQSQDQFFDALQKFDGLIDQIFPAERCVLIMATTHRNIDYGCSFVNSAMRSNNEKVFMLVRNGMNIYFVSSPVESHLGADLLFPSQADQDRIFAGWDGTQITFNDVSYTDKLNAHERFATHYKRFLVLACGLDHRLKLFGRFYPGEESLHFVSQDFQSRYCRFVFDEQGGAVLPKQQRKNIFEWVKEKNLHIRSGSRVLCHWNSMLDSECAPAAFSAASSSQVYFPLREEEVSIVYRNGDRLFVDVTVAGQSGWQKPSRTFSCSVNIRAERVFFFRDSMPYLCLDAVTPEELSDYIHHRDSRGMHIFYLRFFKRALAILTKEREEELPSRAALRVALDDGRLGNPKDRDQIVNKTVAAWRSSRRGAPLPDPLGGGSEKGVRDWRSLLDQMYVVCSQEAICARILEWAGSRKLALVRATSIGAKKLAIYVEPTSEQRNDLVEPHAWVRRIVVTLTKTTISEAKQEWVILPTHFSDEVTLFESDNAAEWGAMKTGFRSLEHKNDLCSRVSNFKRVAARLSPSFDHAEFDQLVGQWRHAINRAQAEYGRAIEPSLILPLALIKDGKANQVKVLGVGINHAGLALLRHSPDDVTRAEFLQDYAKAIRTKSENLAELADNASWSILTLDAKDFHGDLQTAHCTKLDRGVRSPILARSLFGIVSERCRQSGTTVLLPDGVDLTARDGFAAVDDWLGNHLPADYSPVQVTEVSLSLEKTTEAMNAWMDVQDLEEKADGELKPRYTMTQLIPSASSYPYLSAGGSSRVFYSFSAAQDWLGSQGWQEAGEDSLPSALTPPAGVRRFIKV